ncbi:MAG: hypothetical protein ACXVZX_02540, partial [Terriglobales bacterium]
SASALCSSWTASFGMGCSIFRPARLHILNMCKRAPTAQNYRRMEDDLRLLIPKILDTTDADIVAKCEQLVRNYDPCISCSTHFLKLRMNRQ